MKKMLFIIVLASATSALGTDASPSKEGSNGSWKDIKTHIKGMTEEIAQVKEKYKDAFAKQDQLSGNPDFQKEVQIIKDTFKKSLNGLLNKYNPEMEKASNEIQTIMQKYQQKAAAK